VCPGEVRRAGGTLASAFERATAVEPLGDGAWGATCDGAWATQLGANGGFLAALVLRAMIAQLDDPAREARSLTCHYLRPPDMGELRVRSSTSAGGLFEEDGELWSRDGVLLAQSRQLALLLADAR
jgi:hypothetical protein